MIGEYRTMTLKTAYIARIREEIDGIKYQCEKHRENLRSYGYPGIEYDKLDRLSKKHVDDVRKLEYLDHLYRNLVEEIQKDKCAYDVIRLGKILINRREIAAYQLKHYGFDEIKARAYEDFLKMLDKIFELGREYREANKKRQVRTPLLRECAKLITRALKANHKARQFAAKEIKRFPTALNIYTHQHTIVFGEEFDHRMSRIWFDIVEMSPKVSDDELKNYLSEQLDTINDAMNQFEAGKRSCDLGNALHSESRQRACAEVVFILEELISY